MICFCCKKRFQDLYTLIRHFKLVHGLNTNDKITCLENRCSQSFPNLSSFKRHVQKKHLDHNLNDSQIVQESTSFSNISQETNNFKQSHSNICRSENIFDQTPNFVAIENENIDVNECLRNIRNAALSFTLSLHSTNNFSKKDVIKIQDNITEYITDSIIGFIQLLLKKRFPNFEIEYLDINELLNVLKDPFKLCNTDFKLNSLLKHCDLLENSSKVLINTEIVPVNKNGEFMYDEKTDTGVMLPLRFQFRKVFEKIYDFDKCVDFFKSRESCDTISCFTQGKLWHEKVKVLGDKIVVPFFLYADDFEINNPLGSHSTCQSMTAIYYSFPAFGKSNSKLKDIFLAGIFKASDIKNFGNNKCFEVLINEINYLQNEGVTLNSKSGSVTVYFVLGLLLGDNLGMNSILGFTTSFNSNFFCRFCKMHRNSCQSSNKIDNSLLRNEQNYKDDIELDDLSKTGIRENSVLNRIHDFHVVNNFAVDVMHDIFEGICHYNLCHIIIYFTENLQLFTLQQLNIRKQYFDYGRTEIGNISPEIEIHHLHKRHLKMSAREMMCFVHFFPLIVGDLVPENHDVWLFLLEFIEIIDIILSYNISSECLKRLHLLIERHLDMYCKLFHDTLKPKHHFLLHYPTVIKYSGPPRFYWSFTFESKHKEMKRYANIINSRVNIPITLSNKYQLKFAHQIMNIIKTDDFNVFNQNKNSSNTEFVVDILQDGLIEFYNEVKYLDVLYKKNDYFSRFYEKIFIYKIEEFVVSFNKDIYIICEEFEPDYNTHFSAYELDNSSQSVKKLVKFKEFVSGPPIHVTNIANSKKLVRLKEYFF